jgi:hypothetical protein
MGRSQWLKSEKIVLNQGDMRTGRDASLLDGVVSQAEAAAPTQLALLPDDDAEGREVERRGGGRPPGSRNRRSEEYAALLRARYGCPLAVASEIAALNILDESVMQKITRLWGCGRFQAAQLWARINADVQPYHHQKMPTAIILNPGAPGSDAVVIEGRLDADTSDNVAAAGADQVQRVIDRVNAGADQVQRVIDRVNEWLPPAAVGEWDEKMDADTTSDNEEQP